MSEPKDWWNTGWVWFWLFIIWPIGVYGLFLRTKPENRKWWGVGLGVIAIIAIIDPASRTHTKQNHTTYVNKTKNAFTICRESYSTGMVDNCKVSSPDLAVIMYLHSPYTVEAKAACAGTVYAARNADLNLSGWKMRVFGAERENHLTTCYFDKVNL
jgi:hypothetical protein